MTKKDNIDSTPTGSGGGSTRRSFVKALPIAAAGTAAFAARAHAQNSKSQTIPSIRISADFENSLKAPAVKVPIEGRTQSGAELFATLCKQENLAAMFCNAGNYNVINAIAQTGIPSYGGRSEGSMAMAADGFSRVTGETVACSGTEGAGLTHMIQAAYTAWAASTPLLMMASNMTIAQEDSHSFIQQLDQQPLTSGVRKYGKRLTVPERIWEYGGYAFRALKSGIPGPVHLDFPGEVASAKFPNVDNLTMYYDKTRYRSESVPSPSSKEVTKVVDLITKAERPLIIAGQGIFHRKAWDTLLTVAEMQDVGVHATGPSRGHFPDDHPLSLSLAPKAVLSADLIVFIGQYMMPTRLDWRIHPDAKTIRVHPVPEDLGRNWPIDLGIVSDSAPFLEELADRLPKKKRPQWVAEIRAAVAAERTQMDGFYAQGLKYSASTNRLHPAVIGRELYNFFYDGKIDPKQTVNAWGGFTSKRFVPYYLRANRPGQGICSWYQSGTIGTEIPHGLGASAAVKEGFGIQSVYKGAPVLAYATDGSLTYGGLMELDTAVKYRFPLISVVFNNNCWGTYITAEDSPRATQMYLFQENLRYDKVAEAFGCRGEYVQTAEELRAALSRAYDHATKESLPTLINAQSIKEFTSGKLYPPGATFVLGPNIASIDH